MGMCNYGDIFQDKVGKILGDIEDFKMYIYDILFLSKDKFITHIDQIIIIFDRMIRYGMKTKAPKFILELKDNTYLGYIITGDGIKPDTKNHKGSCISTGIKIQLKKSNNWYCPVL